VVPNDGIPPKKASLPLNVRGPLVYRGPDTLCQAAGKKRKVRPQQPKFRTPSMETLCRARARFPEKKRNPGPAGPPAEIFATRKAPERTCLWPRRAAVRQRGGSFPPLSPSAAERFWARQAGGLQCPTVMKKKKPRVHTAVPFTRPARPATTGQGSTPGPVKRSHHGRKKEPCLAASWSVKQEHREPPPEVKEG